MIAVAELAGIDQPALDVMRPTREDFGKGDLIGDPIRASRVAGGKVGGGEPPPIPLPSLSFGD